MQCILVSLLKTNKQNKKQKKKPEHQFDALISVCYERPPRFSGSNERTERVSPRALCRRHGRHHWTHFLGVDVQFWPLRCRKNATTVEKVEPRADDNSELPERGPCVDLTLPLQIEGSKDPDEGNPLESAYEARRGAETLLPEPLDVGGNVFNTWT